MRQSIFRGFLVLLFVSSTVVSASAVPRRDGGPVGPTRLIERVVEIAKHVISALDDVRIQIPTP